MVDSPAMARSRALRGELAGALLALATLACGPDLDRLKFAELEEARAAFLANLDAIRARDAAAYLDSYLDSRDFVAAGPDGIVLGYASLAAARRASNEWPDTLDAGLPTLVWIAPGVVYGAYQYRVSQDGVLSSGWSERVLVKTVGGWKIAVTSVIPTAP